MPFAGRNIIDPMQMIAKWHDNYPKQDLDKNYLGDGLPPCADLPKVQGSHVHRAKRLIASWMWEYRVQDHRPCGSNK